MARIQLGLQDCLYLGNLNAKRDWGHAWDFVEAQWLMLQQASPEDYVIATGEQHSVRDFVNAAAKEIGLELIWQGNGLDEKALDARERTILAVDPRYFRPTEVETLLGNPAKAFAKLGWRAKTGCVELVAEMMREDMAAAKPDHLVRQHGYAAPVRHE